MRGCNAGGAYCLRLGQWHHIGCRGFLRQFLEIEVVEPLGAPPGLFRRNLDVFQVLGGLPKVPVKVADPLAQPLYIAMQQREFLADRASLFAHPGILQHGAHGVQRGHTGGG